MNVFGEYKSEWVKRFPESDLHSTWADDVRTNLEKHRTRVAVLREELEKEEFYVKYLENLLSEAENHRRSITKLTAAAIVVDDQVSSESNGTVNEQGIDLRPNVIAISALKVCLIELGNAILNVSKPGELAKDITGEKMTSENGEAHLVINQNRSTCGSDRDIVDEQFVTVIEVNGLDVEKNARKPLGSEMHELPLKHFQDSVESRTKSLGGEGSGSTSAESSPVVRKKVPPQPPPKRLRRPISAQPLGPKPDLISSANITTMQNVSSINRLETVDDMTAAVTDLPNVDQILRVGAKLSDSRKALTIVPSAVGMAAEHDSVKPGAEICDSLDQTASDTDGNDGSSPAKVSLSTTEGESGGPSETSVGGNDTLKSQASALSCRSDSQSGVSLDGDASGSSPTSGRATSASLNSVPSVDDDDVNDYVNIDYFLKKRSAKKRRDLGESVSTDTDGDDGILEDDEDDMDVDLLLRTLASDNEDDILQDKEDARASGASSQPDTGQHDLGVVGSSANSGSIDGLHELDDKKQPNPHPPPPPSSSAVGSALTDPAAVTPPLPPKTFGRLKKAENQREESAASDAVVEAVSSSDEASKTASVTMSECIVSSILDSEVTYLECLNLLIQYMKALRSTIGTSQPVISLEDLSVVFHKIPELHEMHRTFVEGIRTRVRQPRPPDGRLAVGDHFKLLASRLTTYESFLQNYPRAIETIRKCSAENAKFSEITKDIKLRALKGQAVTLEDLLHKPVARVQKNALVIHDLLKHTPESHVDYKALQVALRMTQCFLNEFNMSATESMFPVHDHTQRHLVKNSFVVELSEGRRKLRHLFLFNDVIVCAKYKPSGREKFTYEVKWYISLTDVFLPPDDSINEVDLKENSSISVLSLKSQVATVRDQILVDESYSKEKSRPTGRHLDKHRKKLAELQAQLVLASPNLVFRIGQKGSHGKTYVFFLSSKFEKAQWAEAITAVQTHAPAPSSTLSLYELQTWITTCRKFLQTNMGSFLLKSGKDDSLVGDLHVVLKSIVGMRKPADMYLCLEVDSYGHFFQKGKTKIFCGPDSSVPFERHEFVVELDGSHVLRLICYERVPSAEPIIRGRATIELNKSWLTGRLQEKTISLQDFTVEMAMKFTQSEISLRRVPSSKPCSLFGVKIASVAKKEKRSIPFLITCCVQEIEKRGLHELGLYRVSGSSTDVQKLRRTFESNAYEAEQLVKEMDIHSVTGIFKLYLRELPEGLFTDELYNKLLDTFEMADGEAKNRELLQLFESLPTVNKDIILYLIEHMMKINKEEASNKMSLQNLATVFGPTLIRPSTRLESSGHYDRLASGTIDVMTQAGILYFYLKKRSSGQTLGTPSDLGGGPASFR